MACPMLHFNLVYNLGFSTDFVVSDFITKWNDEHSIPSSSRCLDTKKQNKKEINT